MVEYRVALLWADRVRMVQRYLERPATWPDGIDTKYERWFQGHEAYWREKVGHLVDGGWEGKIDDEAAYARWAEQVVRAAAPPDEPGGKVEVLKAVAEALVDGHLGGRPKTIEGEPWVEAGVSRRTWERRKAALRPVD